MEFKTYKEKYLQQTYIGKDGKTRNRTNQMLAKAIGVHDYTLRDYDKVGRKARLSIDKKIEQFIIDNPL